MTCLLTEFCEQQRRLVSHDFIKRARARSHNFIKMSKFDVDEQVTDQSPLRQHAHPKFIFLRVVNMQGYDPINKSYTREQHRLANFFGEQQQRFWKLSEWPGWVQDIALTCPKDYGQRTRMFYFLVRNNLYGPMARDWVMACDYIDNKLIPYQYEEAVRMDMASLVKKALAGQVAAAADTPTMCMPEGKVIKGLNPANFPSYEHIQFIKRTAARVRARDALEAASAPPERPQPRAVLYIAPSTKREQTRRLTSGIRFLPGRGLMYRDLSGSWRMFKN